MNIKVITNHDEDYRSGLEIKVNDKEIFSVSDGEPEDSNLNRDFNDCYKIPELMKMAYEAGKAGEEFIVENIEENEA